MMLRLLRPAGLHRRYGVGRHLGVGVLVIAMTAGILFLAIPSADAAKPRYVLCKLDDGTIEKAPVPVVTRNGRAGTVGDAVRFCINRLGGHPVGVGS